MKKHIITALFLTGLSASAFALPQDAPQPLLGEGKDGSVKTLIGFGSNPLAEGGADRLHERLLERLRVAADGAERVGSNRLAEGGADRLQERLRVAADGAERVGVERLAEGGAERLQERLRVAEDGAERTPGQRIG